MAILNLAWKPGLTQPYSFCDEHRPDFSHDENYGSCPLSLSDIKVFPFLL